MRDQAWLMTAGDWVFGTVAVAMIVIVFVMGVIHRDDVVAAPDCQQYLDAGEENLRAGARHRGIYASGSGALAIAYFQRYELCVRYGR